MTIPQQFEESSADLEDLMSVPALTAEDHSAIQRHKVAARRLVEDVREEARLRQKDIFAIG